MNESGSAESSSEGRWQRRDSGKQRETHSEATVETLPSCTLDSVVSSPLVGVSRSFAIVVPLGFRQLSSVSTLLIITSIILIIVESEIVVEIVVEYERVETVFKVGRGTRRVTKVEFLSDSHF